MVTPILSEMLTKAELDALRVCFQPIKKEYAKGDIIISLSSHDLDTLGLVESGTAYLVTSNASGQRRILDYYERGCFFGRRLLPLVNEKPFCVTAKSRCTVLFISYQHLVTCCHNNCTRHVKLIDCLFSYISWKANMHIDILGQQALRDRLLLYFEYLKLQNKSRHFYLPLSYTDLADYLAVNRSSMMRELKKLNEEGLVETTKNLVVLPE